MRRTRPPRSPGARGPRPTGRARHGARPSSGPHPWRRSPKTAAMRASPRAHPNRKWGALRLAGGARGGLERAPGFGGRRVRDHAAELVTVDQRDPVVALDHVVPGKRPLAPQTVDEHHVAADLEAVLRLH